MFITVSGHATDLGKGLAVVHGSLITIAVGHRRYMYTLALHFLYRVYGGQL